MVFDLLFRVGPAIQVVFELGFEPKEELFYELTAEQYSQWEKEGNDISQKWYTIIPEDRKFDAPELLIVDAEEKKSLLDAARYINKLCDKAGVEHHFSTFEEKLAFAASKLPAVFSESSKFKKNKKAEHLKIVE